MLNNKIRTLTRNKIEFIIGILISLTALIIYTLTLCPTVNFIDSGELATVAYTLGIAHPTGYPLFTIIGNVFSHLPLGLRIIQQLNLLSGILCSIGLFFFFRLLVFLNSIIFQNENHRNSELILMDKKIFIQIYLPAIFGTLILGFSETFWSQAISIEVYSLHILLLSAVLYLFVRAVYESNESRIKSAYWLAFAYVLGLSFTNHMTTILVIPAVMYLFFYENGFNRKTLRKLLLIVVPFLFGISVYLFLPLRSSQAPLLNWGNPIDLEKLFWHLSGKVYRVWIFSSTESALKQFNYFLNTLLPEFFYFPVILACLGIISLFKNNKQLFYFTILLFVTCIFYSINYDIHDIDSYFLLSYFVIAIWTGIGVSRILQWSKLKNTSSILIISIILLLSIIVYNYDRVDESKSYLVEDYTKDLLKSVEPNGLIISYQWDYFVSAAYYFQIVEHYRPDVIIIDKELLRRSWYYVQLKSRYPWLIDLIKKEMDDFLRELKKFEHDEPYNPQVIEYYYARLIRSIIDYNYEQKNIYITPEIEPQYISGYKQYPKGLVFKLLKGDGRLDASIDEFNYRLPKRKNKYVDGILSLYARATYNNALYLNSIGEKIKAEKYLNQILLEHPELKNYINSYGNY